MQASINPFESITQICSHLDEVAPLVLLNTHSASYRYVIHLNRLLDNLGFVNGINSLHFYNLNELRYKLSEVKEKIAPIADPKLEAIVDKINRLIRLPSLSDDIMQNILNRLALDHKTLALISAVSKDLNWSLRDRLFKAVVQISPLKYYFKQIGESNSFEIHLNMWNITWPRKDRLTMDDLEEFTKRCPTLHFLSLQTVDIPRLPVGLERWEYLRTLELGHFIQVTSADIKRVGSLTKLETLKIDNCEKLKAGHLGFLSRLVNLQDLKLSRCFKLPSSNLLCLSVLQGLKQLELNGFNSLNRSDFKALAYLTNLSSLTLPQCRRLAPDGIGHLTGLVQLQILEFSFDPLFNLMGTGKFPYPQFTDSALAHIGCLTNLRILRLYECRRFSSEGLSHLQRLENLETLIMKNYEELTDLSLRHLRGLSNLQTLDLSDSFAYGSSREHREKQLRLNFTGLVYLEPLSKLRHLFITKHPEDLVEGFSASMELMLARLTRAIPPLSILKIKSLS